MKAYITNIKLCGIKNIDKEISLDFYKKTIPKNFDLNQSNMKAIYGENGVGKSAIIHAIDIYKNISINRNYVSDSRNKEKIKELINKKTQSLSIEVSVLFMKNNIVFAHYTHRIEIKEYGKEYRIDQEIFYDNKGRLSQNTKKNPILEIQSGVIQNEDKYKPIVIKDTLNLLDTSTFVSLLIKQIAQNGIEKMYKEYDMEIINIGLCFVTFILDITVILNESDQHDSYISGFQMSELTEDLEVDKFLKVKLTHSDQDEIMFVGLNNDIISKDQKEVYLHRVENITKFIKLFKSDLLNIEVDMKENRNKLICEKYFVYENYRIHVEFESTGVKKLVRLYDAFESFVNGGIVFIDEMDANIHDVYLINLLEYFINYAQGQLCFTTHNLGPMEVLRKQKFAIDFLSNDHIITQWKKRGNYSVVNLYREGMIEYSPFNIEPFDFAGVFKT